MNKIPGNLAADVKNALREDIGSGDVTALLIDALAQSKATLVTRQAAVICGIEWFNEVFQQLSPEISIKWHVSDGEKVRADTVLCELSGSSRALLTGERTAMNFLQTLSGTATYVATFVEKVSHTQVKLLDTRKTLPGLRMAQKYAVKCGGGHNHRIGLFDAFLIKENHIIAAGNIADAVTRARAISPAILLEVEVESLDELQQAIDASVDRVLLDNFNENEMRKAVSLASGKMPLEASGNVSLETITGIAETGVDFISIGSLTKDVQAIDLSMRFEKPAPV